MASAIASQAIFPGAAVAQSGDKVSLASQSVLATHLASIGGPMGGIAQIVSSGALSFNDWTLATGQKYLRAGSSYFVSTGGKLVAGSGGQQIGIAVSIVTLSITIQTQQTTSTTTGGVSNAALQAQIAVLAAQVAALTAAGGSFRSGTFSIGNATNTGTISGLGLPFVPSRVLAIVRSPSNGLLLSATIIGDPTNDGFTFGVNGLTDSSNYKLDWIAVS